MIGVIHTINAFLPLLRNGVAKRVITLGSGIGDYNFILATEDPAAAPYCISKAAVVMVVAKYAAKYKKEGFVFLTISPGLVDTSTGPKLERTCILSESEKQLLTVFPVATKEELEAYNNMIAGFRRVVPNFDGAITPEQSVTAMLKVFDRLSVEDNRLFVSHKGNKEWL